MELSRGDKIIVGRRSFTVVLLHGEIVLSYLQLPVMRSMENVVSWAAGVVCRGFDLK